MSNICGVGPYMYHVLKWSDTLLILNLAALVFPQKISITDIQQGPKNVSEFSNQ